MITFINTHPVIVFIAVALFLATITPNGGGEA